MPYLWNNIIQEWLLNQNLDFAPEEIVNAFNQVENTMGSDWISLTFGKSRGIWNTISIIELGKMLVDVEKTPNGRNGDEDSTAEILLTGFVLDILVIAPSHRSFLRLFVFNKNNSKVYF
jgi:hypothetical protein